MTVDSQVIATKLFRIAQEAVHNAMKHGEATRVLITLSRRSDKITLAIRDNGIGIPRNLPHANGMGMGIMQHRAESIGAAIKSMQGSERRHRGGLHSRRARLR